MQKKNRSLFYPYHPFATFASKQESTFLNAHGEPVLKGWMRHYSTDDNPDIAAIFDVAEDAFERLTQYPFDEQAGYEHVISSPEDFDQAVTEGYLETIDDLMKSLCARIERGGVQILSKRGGTAIDPEDMIESSNPWKVGLLWRFLEYDAENRSELAPMFRSLFLLATLECVGNVLVAMCLDGRGQGEDTFRGHDCYYSAISIENEYQLTKKVKRHIAKKGGLKKHAKHTEPKKEEVRDWWLKWQTNPKLFKNKTAFDEAMFDKTGMKVRTIQVWRKELQKEHAVC